MKLYKIRKYLHLAKMDHLIEEEMMSIIKESFSIDHRHPVEIELFSRKKGLLGWWTNSTSYIDSSSNEENDELPR